MQSRLAARSSTDFHPGRGFKRAAALLLAVAVVSSLGCPGNRTTQIVPPPAKKFAGITLTLGCPDPAVAEAFSRLARGWAARTGAVVEIVPADTAEIAIVSAADVGRLADADDARPVPEELKALDHPGHWARILPVFRDRLAGWAGTPRAIPLAGEGHVLVANRELLHNQQLRERYAAKTGRPLPELPGTWDDLAELSEVLAEQQRAALPVAADPALELLRVAASHDRPMLTEIQRNQAAATPMEMLAFTHRLETGAPRLDQPGFAAALKWQKRTANRAPGDAVKALESGEAACALLSLAELARLPRRNGTIDERFLVGPIPGSRTAYGPGGDVLEFTGVPGGNYVPFHTGGWFGVVRGKCNHPAAAFELLADLASPARSIELISNPSLGFGPFRSEHLEQPTIWQAYGFDAARNQALTDALRRNCGSSAINPTFGLRGPDAATLMKLLEESLGEPNPLATAQTKWQKHDAALGDRAKTLRRNAAGLP